MNDGLRALMVEQRAIYEYWKTRRAAERAKRQQREARQRAKVPPVPLDRLGEGQIRTRAQLAAYRRFLLDRMGASPSHRAVMEAAAREYDAAMERDRTATHYKSTKRRRLKPMTVDRATETRRKVA